MEKALKRMDGQLLNPLRGGIRGRIFLLAALIMVPFAILMAVTYHQRYENRRAAALQTEQEVAEGLAVTFAAYVQGIMKQSISVGHAIMDFSPQSSERITRLLTAVRGHSPSLQGMAWLSPDGKVLCSSDPVLVGTSLAHRPYLQKVLAGAEWALGDLLEKGAVTALPTIAMATAVRDDDGILRGIVVVGIEPTRLQEVALTQKRSADGALALFDSRGVVVYQSMLEAPTWEQRISWQESDAVLRHVLQTGVAETGIQRLPLRGGIPWLSARVPLPELGWVAGAGRPASTALAPVRRGMIQDILLGSMTFVLAFLLAFFLGRNIIRPLLRLEQDAELMGSGRVITETDPAAPREVRHLHQTVARMASELIGRAEALQDSEGVLRTIFDSVYDSIIIHSDDGRIVDVNRRFLETFHVTREQAVELTIADISAETAPMETTPALWAAVMAGEKRFFQWLARRPDDASVFDVEVFLCTVRIKGRILIMANVRDISDRQRAQQELQQAKDELEIRVQERTRELEQAFEQLKHETEERLSAVEELRQKEHLLIQQSRLAAMGEMITNIAHQWRQPLNVLGLIVQELVLSRRSGGYSDEELEARVAKAMEVIGHMSQTIDDFRNFFSPDKVKVRFSTNEVVEKTLSLMEGDFRRLQVQVEVFAEEHCSVEGFRNEYAQVVLNILANARDVFRERKVENPRITARLFRQDGRSVVTIADNGGGIAADVIGKIFDPYFTTKGPDMGTGIGLFMSKTIIEKNMNGALTVRNIADGAEFRIEV